MTLILQSLLAFIVYAGIGTSIYFTFKGGFKS